MIRVKTLSEFGFPNELTESNYFPLGFFLYISPIKGAMHQKHIVVRYHTNS